MIRVKTDMPKVLALIPTLHDDPSLTIECLRRQSVGVDSVVVACGSRELFDSFVSDEFARAIYVEPPRGEVWGTRIAAALNACLATVNLGDYDYLIRVDADTLIPSDFIKDNIALDADLVGEAGLAMLMRTNTFAEVAGGKFEGVLAEDTYLAFKFRAAGKKVVLYATPPRVLRTPGTAKPWRFFLLRGQEMYRLGYEPFHVLGNVGIQRSNVLAVVGYALSVVMRQRRYDFAPKIFSYQITNFWNDARLAIKGKKFVRLDNYG